VISCRSPSLDGRHRSRHGAWLSQNRGVNLFLGTRRQLLANRSLQGSRGSSVSIGPIAGRSRASMDQHS
jgi:hypothetical protein